MWCHGMLDVTIVTKGAGLCEGSIGTKLTSRNSDFNLAILNLYLAIVCLYLTILKKRSARFKKKNCTIYCKLRTARGKKSVVKTSSQRKVLLILKADKLLKIKFFYISPLI